MDTEGDEDLLISSHFMDEHTGHYLQINSPAEIPLSSGNCVNDRELAWKYHAYAIPLNSHFMDGLIINDYETGIPAIAIKAGDKTLILNGDFQLTAIAVAFELFCVLAIMANRFRLHLQLKRAYY